MRKNNNKKRSVKNFPPIDDDLHIGFNKSLTVI